MYVLCFHQGKRRRALWVCRHCSIALEECPCSTYRNPDGKCVACQGSGWVAVVRGRIAEFLEYVSRDPDPKPKRQVVDW